MLVFTDNIYVFFKEYSEDEEENEMPVLPYQTIYCHPSPPKSTPHPPSVAYTPQNTHMLSSCVFSLFFSIVSVIRKDRILSPSSP